jgi:hypothetical protein
VHIDNKGAREFTIVGDDKRKGIFIDVLGDPSRWINAAMHAAKLAAGTQESAVDQLVRSDIYQPDSMLRHQGYLVKRSLISAANWQKYARSVAKPERRRQTLSPSVHPTTVANPGHSHPTQPSRALFPTRARALYAWAGGGLCCMGTPSTGSRAPTHPRGSCSFRPARP